ncbi:hypothetical protein OSTOST_03761 [Ostertagia ostertagi]
MIEIAASAGVPFVPDPDVMRDDEVAQAEKMLIDFKQAGATGFNAGPPGPPPPPPPSSTDGLGYGWNLPPGSVGGPPFPPSNPPPPPPGPGDDFGGGGGSGGHIYEVPNVSPQREDFSNPAPNSAPPSGMIQLPKIGPNGLPIYPGQDGPTYPTLSQRVWSHF